MSSLSCRQVTASLFDYRERDLLPPRRLEVEAHLRRCDRCVVYMRQYEQTIALSKAAFDERPP